MEDWEGVDGGEAAARCMNCWLSERRRRVVNVVEAVPSWSTGGKT